MQLQLGSGPVFFIWKKGREMKIEKPLFLYCYSRLMSWWIDPPSLVSPFFFLLLLLLMQLLEEKKKSLKERQNGPSSQYRLFLLNVQCVCVCVCKKKLGSFAAEKGAAVIERTPSICFDRENWWAWGEIGNSNTRRRISNIKTWSFYNSYIYQK